MILRNMLSGQIFAVMVIEVEMAKSNAIFNQTKNLMINISDILTFLTIVFIASNIMYYKS